MAFLRRKLRLEIRRGFKQREKLDHYLAQIAYEVYLSNTRIDAEAVNRTPLKAFLMDFEFEDERKNREERDKMRVLNAKMFVAGLTGADMRVVFDAEERNKSPGPNGTG